jgi:hypothetical protein
MSSMNQDPFLANRGGFAKSVGCENLYEYIDQFALYAGEHTIGNKIFTYELLKEATKVPGDIVEFGCWKGSNLMFLAKMKALLEPNSMKRIIGFDNFSGLPAPVENDGDFAVDQIGNYCGSEEVLREAIRLFGFEESIELVVGDANETIPAYLKSHPESLISFAYIDFDLYEPCKNALILIGNSLSVGGIIAFDEAGTKEWPGETLAMKEFLASTQHKYESINNTLSRQPTIALRRVQ